ncbi:carbohydrate-binding domain-containing protein [Paenibacillus endoradicis]|uniref:carbohydrate-binding domain-containing protein n=1 Tax=Paenibacillus endoradicis TaxID=2972487 RepID=UPI002159514B|nr:carbohydrate-binding domain-containing protein [Paenibacillus endoradicis]MCR8659052.1 carbohydrate-binding domain-containing protein [Paenibacillus endoradicis]
MKLNIYQWFGISMLTMSLLLAGCTASSSEVMSGVVAENMNGGSTTKVSLADFDEEDLDSSWDENSSKQIKLNGNSITTSASSGVFIEGTTVTIALPGTYVVSGELNDGQIHVKLENDGNVKLVLNGATIHNENSAAIYIEEAGKTIITLAEGTQNNLSDGSKYVYENNSDEPSGTLYSKDDLSINGTGTLTVNANFNDAIVGKDILKLVDGTYIVTSADDGIIGRDVLAIRAGKYTLDVNGDAMKSTNDNEEELGAIYIVDGTFAITSGNDGIDSIGAAVIENGQFNIVSGEGSQSQIDDTTSAKGIKSATDLTIYDGTFNVNSADDAFHSNGVVNVHGGQYTITTGDDGFHADSTLTINDGIIQVNESYEGLEGNQITINGGNISIVASDDGVNVAGGNDESAFGGRGGASFATDSDALLKITGGLIKVNAKGDGLDSNGNVEMSGGTVVVNGPEDNGNGPLDYDGTFNMSGGTLVAVGSSGMAQATSDTSTQPAMLMYYTETQAANTLVQLANEAGEIIVAFEPDKTYQSVMISSPLIEQGQTYTLYSGGQTELDELLNIAENTTGSLGNKVVSFTIADMITYVDANGITTAKGGMGGFGGGMGGGRGQVGGNRDENGEMPTRPEGENGEMKMPDGEMPTMPNGDMPTRPEGENGEMKMPAMADGQSDSSDGTQ